MLVELMVENYAVIDRIRVRFHRGLNLLTGETGSGKSIVVDSLGLLLGGRASSDVIRTGADRARISGIFEVSGDPAIRAHLEQSGIGLEDGELLLEREILSSGKSRAFASSRPVTVALLRDLAPFLGDIHGQHEQQLLFSSEAQRAILDDFARNEDLLLETARLYREWRDCSAELEELDRREQEQLRLADLWTFQIREIESAAPKPGEDAALDHERRVLQNVTRLAENTQAAYDALYDAPDSAIAQIRNASKRLEDLARIDSELSSVSEQLKPVRIAVEEAAFALRDYLCKLEADPGRLEEVEHRLASLEKVKRKYGPTLAEVATFLEDIRQKMAALETAGARRVELGNRRDKLASEYERVAGRLSERRREAGLKLQQVVEKELAALAMERSVFLVDLRVEEWGPQGIDSVVFLVSTNPGEEPRPIERVASGGEISRIALALKTIINSNGLEAKGAVRTLVFDEVDAGIGGSVAETVGRRLKHLSAANQVLCVTHQPQIARFADHHYRVEKKDANGRTVVGIEELRGEERTREVGRMLSGQRLTMEALRHAEQLIKHSQG
jgi:DNA repair protein RecN (Recombination protein N)